MRPLSRRNFLAAASAVAAAPLLPARLFAATPDNTPVHGLSAFGELKYPVDFKHFDYINPDAPKGGRMNFAPPNWAFNQSVLTFNTLNTFVFKGQAPVRAEMCFDTLMLRALDEPDAIYGLLAESVSISADRNTFTFKLRPEARWHDGAPLTAEDVAFTYKIFRDKDRAHPALWDALKDVVEAVAVDDHTVRIVFDGKQGEQAVLSAATMPIVSKAYYEANDFGASTMKPPLGSGPYRMGRISAGSSIEYERVADYWAQDLPVNRGQNNFDLIRIEFFADRDVAFEAFKKGDIHFRQEFTSRTWATAYHFPAIKEGRVIKREFPRELAPQMQAIGLNQRRPQFQDVRVRRAIAMCFDFEWMKKNLFFNSYDRSQSSFEQSDFKATGLPSPEELALLEPFRAELPPEAFGEAVTLPVTSGQGRDRKVLGEAAKLLADAGWKRQGAFVMNDKGQKLTAEVIADDDGLVRVFTPWVDNLKAIGVDASVRLLDPTQSESREQTFDFDMAMLALNVGATPTSDSLAQVYHSRAADQQGSRNYPATRSPAVDACIEAAGRAKSREELIVAIRALDRVLRARQDWIPTYYLANHRAAYWDMFGFKEPKPDYGFPVEAMWWFDEAKAKAIGKG